jgi:hypothetical protein
MKQRVIGHFGAHQKVMGREKRERKSHPKVAFLSLVIF